jgi:hypothetical protein
MVSPADDVVLVGKITLPAYYNNKPVISVGDFRGQNEITGIYFEEGT